VSTIWVLGARGQVGSHLMRLLGNRARGFDSGELDFLSPDFAEIFEALIAAKPPKLIINMAAYTDVQAAEIHTEQAVRINARAVAIMCSALAPRKIPLIHGSTDYVFSGHSEAAYVESAAASPLNAYGKSKLAGEQAVQCYAHGYIMRFSWVFDGVHKNFVTTMRSLMLSKDHLRVVADQIGAPSYAGHIANALLQFSEQVLSALPPESGVYHACAAGHTSWHGFACAIRDALRAHGQEVITQNIFPITSEEYGGTCQRPLQSRLNTEKLAALGVTMPHWREGLAQAMAEMVAQKS